MIYRHNDSNEFFLKANNNHVRKFTSVDLTSLGTYFTDFTFDYIKKIDNLTVAGIQVQYFLFRHLIL